MDEFNASHAKIKVSVEAGDDAAEGVTPPGFSPSIETEVGGFESGSSGRTRTCNTLVNSQVLCQLSYRGA